MDLLKKMLPIIGSIVLSIISSFIEVPEEIVFFKFPLIVNIKTSRKKDMDKQ